ncbi:hypothetical protein Tco_1422333 [Tanacetum coccineum]
MANIIQNHPIRLNIAASSLVPWIYLGQLWHTLQEDRSKYRLKFMLDRKELTLTLMISEEYFICLKLSITIMNDLLLLQNYAKLLWEGLHYALEHPSTQIPYPRFTKLIVGHYMIVLPKISRIARGKYHNLEDDVMVKNIFNLGKPKDGVGMKIPSWMIRDEMKLTNHYRMYVVVFRVDVPTNQSQPIESTQGTHRTTSAPRSCNSETDEGESNLGFYNWYQSLVALDLGSQGDTVIYLEHPKDKELTKTQVPVYVAQGLIMERQQSQADVTKMIADAIQQERENLRSEISSQINGCYLNHIPRMLILLVGLGFYVRSYFACAPTFYRCLRDQDDLMNEAPHKGEIVQRGRRHLSMEPLSLENLHPVKTLKVKPGPSTSGNQEQSDDFDFWTDSYVTDDDELPTEKVSQELMDEMSQTVDEAKLRKVVDEMLRQRCTLRDEHQYHIDQMQNFLKNDIVWESKKEILVLQHPQRPTLVVQSCQRDSKAPALSLVNQDLLYLKK